MEVSWEAITIASVGNDTCSQSSDMEKWEEIESRILRSLIHRDEREVKVENDSQVFGLNEWWPS